MRLQLIAAAAAAAWWAAAPARAQTVADARSELSGALRVYADDDRVTVVTPSAAAVVPLAERWLVDVNVAVDVVSAASVDVVTAASPVDVRERRYEVDAGAAFAPRADRELRVRAIGSHENDYDALRASLGGRVEVARRNATIDVAYTYAADRAGMRTDPDFERTRTGHELALSFTQIVDRRTYVDLVAEAHRYDGYHASPYRSVPVVDPASPQILRVDEVTPAVRTSAAALVRVRRALEWPARWYGRADYRLYVDDWDVVSHTAEAGAIVPLADRAELGVRLRGYAQSAAEFYRPVYQTPAPAFRTRDRKLGPMRSLYADWTIRVGWFIASAGVARWWYLDDPAQSGRLAVIASAGVAVPLAEEDR
ncbi:MAG: DUF3570 domain-containing protein [Deltaproteobacteria bacterium]|nr:MAG: DUF3570 domain-containing protein [Deltaproteobacteria bacterium]